MSVLNFMAIPSKVVRHPLKHIANPGKNGSIKCNGQIKSVFITNQREIFGKI